MTEPRLQRLPELARSPRRLGRHVEHDPRSLAYAAPVLPRTALASKRWTRRAPVFDQGSLGSCTGNAAAGWVGTDNATRQGLTTWHNAPVDEALARELYHLATTLDEFDGTWPPEDSGSSGNGAAKALRQLGLSPSYRHAFALQAVETALQTGPVMVGTSWYNSMFDPEPDGRIPVRPASGLAGGHEYCVDELDVQAGRVWLTNSWSDSWGIGGRGYLTLPDLQVLLADQGDVTVPAATVPAPPSPPSGCLGARALRAWRAITDRRPT